MKSIDERQAIEVARIKRACITGSLIKAFKEIFSAFTQSWAGEATEEVFRNFFCENHWRCRCCLLREGIGVEKCWLFEFQGMLVVQAPLSCKQLRRWTESWFWTTVWKKTFYFQIARQLKTNLKFEPTVCRAELKSNLSAPQAEQKKNRWHRSST